MPRFFIFVLAWTACILAPAGCSPSGGQDGEFFDICDQNFIIKSDLDAADRWNIVYHPVKYKNGDGYVVAMHVKRDSCEAWVYIASKDSLFYLMMRDLPTADDEFDYYTISSYFPKITWGQPGSFISYSGDISGPDGVLLDCVIIINGSKCERSMATSIVESISYSIRNE